MGLNIGLDVQKQYDGPMGLGRNPTIEEATAALREVAERFEGAVGAGDVRIRKGYGNPSEEWYVFDLRISGRGDRLEEQGYTQDDVYAALYRMALGLFSVFEGGLRSDAWWSG